MTLSKNFYEINTWYSLTLNPSDQYQSFGKNERFKKVKNRLYEALLTAEHWGVIEISEPRGMKVKGYSGPRIHYHGFIQWSTRKRLQNFLCNGFYKLTRFTSVDIDTIKDHILWYEYINKQHVLPSARKISSYDDLPQSIQDIFRVERNTCSRTSEP